MSFAQNTRKTQCTNCFVSGDDDKNTPPEETIDNPTTEVSSGTSKVFCILQTFRKPSNLMFILTVLINGVNIMAHFGFMFIFMDKRHVTDTVKGVAVQVQSWIQVSSISIIFRIFSSSP